MENKEPPENLPKWEEDFYEVLPIVCSPLTADAKVARIKKIFEKLLAAEYEREAERQNNQVLEREKIARSTALDECIAAIKKEWHTPRNTMELSDFITSLHALKEKK